MTPLHRIIRALDLTRATAADFARSSRISTNQINTWRRMFLAEHRGVPFTGSNAPPTEADAARVESAAADMLRASLTSLGQDRAVTVTLGADVAAGLRAALEGAS